MPCPGIPPPKLHFDETKNSLQIQHILNNKINKVQFKKKKKNPNPQIHNVPIKPNSNC